MWIKQPAPYYKITGPQWSNRPGRTFTWSNTAGSIRLNHDELGATRRAFAAWAAVANVNFREVSQGSAVSVGIDDISSLGVARNYFHSVCVREFLFFCTERRTERYRTRILIDPKSQRDLGFYNTMLHEIGHMLGLEHSTLLDAVMYGSQNPATDWEQRDTLQPDDIAGARALYGARQTVAYSDVNSLGVGWGFSDNVSVTGDRDDYYSFVLVRPHTMQIYLRPTGGDADVVLLDSAGTELARSALAGTEVDTIERHLPAGEYIIRVDAFFNSSDYQLNLWNMDGRSLSRAYDLGDLSYDPIGRRNVVWTDTVNEVNNNHDYFSFVVEKRTQLQFGLTGLNGNARLNLLDQSGTTVAFANSSVAAGYSINEWLSAGTYHLHVQYIGADRGRSLERTVDTRTSHSTDYTLVYTRLGEFPPPSAIELGDLTNQASLGSSRGAVSFNNDAHFRFTLTAPTTIRFELADLSTDADLYLLNSSGEEIAQSVYGGTVEDSIDRELEAGTYYVRVEAVFYGVATDYNLRYRTVGDIGDLTTQAAARTVTGTFGGSGDDNYFRFTLTQTQTIRFELKDLSGDADLFLSGLVGYGDRPFRAGRRRGRVRHPIA